MFAETDALNFYRITDASNVQKNRIDLKYKSFVTLQTP